MNPPTAGLLVLHVDPPLTWQHESTHDRTDGLGVADCHGGDDVARPLGLVDEDVAAHARRVRTGLGSPARCTARYTVERATENSSASSALVCVPARQSSTRCASWAGLSLGCLPRSRPLALATFMPSLVRILIKSDSNSAIIPRTLYSSRPTGSVGSCTEPPMFSLTPAAVNSSTMVRASVSERQAVEFRDDQGVAVPASCEGLAQPGPSAVGAGQTVVDVDPIRLHAERDQRVALRGEVLRIGTAPAISDEHSGHRITVAVRLPSPGIIAGGSSGNRRRRSSWGVSILWSGRRCPVRRSSVGTAVEDVRGPVPSGQPGWCQAPVTALG